jgi:uncharacterized membrane protein
MTLYLLVKWLHVLLAIAAMGANITYAVWLLRVRQEPAMLPWVLRGIKVLDDRIANPAYGLLLVTGVVMVVNSGLPWSTPWLSLAMGLYAVVALLGFFGYTPTLRRQIALAESQGGSSREYQRMARRGQLLGIILAVLAVAITFLMVVKPGLWRE